MPRKNKQIPHTQFTFASNETGKTRYASEKEAQAAAELQMLRVPNLQLYVYKSDANGGWYLTRKPSSVNEL